MAEVRAAAPRCRIEGYKPAIQGALEDRRVTRLVQHRCQVLPHRNATRGAFGITCGWIDSSVESPDFFPGGGVDCKHLAKWRAEVKAAAIKNGCGFVGHFVLRREAVSEVAGTELPRHLQMPHVVTGDLAELRVAGTSGVVAVVWPADVGRGRPASASKLGIGAAGGAQTRRGERESEAGKRM